MNPEQAQTSGGWDWWPLARLLITGAALGLAAHYWWGWTPDLHGLARKPREVFEVLSLFTLVSFALAHLYVALLLFPIYAAVTLNDLFYDSANWALRTICGIRSEAALKPASLTVQVALFAGLLYTVVVAVR